ncbi:MAG: DUF72 domain-containing protein [Microcoleaceae cyanobacterium]
MPQFLLGCAVWAYKDWVGEFYPPGSRASDFLKLYSNRLYTVEGNSTFYSTPNAETLLRWVAQTPPEFRFCLKVPQAITHKGLLQPKISQVLEFLENMQVLNPRQGPMFVQLPARYGPNHFDDLQAFLESWPQEKASVALEVRHLDWFQEPWESRLNQLLETLNIGRVLLDSRPIYLEPVDQTLIDLERKKPNVPVPFCLTAPFTLIRFISHPNPEVNQPFWQEWSQQIQQWLQQGTQVYFFVHCPLEERSPYNAREFQHILEQTWESDGDHRLKIPPLPWEQLIGDPVQLSLW